MSIIIASRSNAELYIEPSPPPQCAGVALPVPSLLVSPKHPFFSPELFQLLIDRQILDLKGKLLKDLSTVNLPPLTPKQSQTFNALVAHPSEWIDREGNLVLKQFSGTDLLEILYNASAFKKTPIILSKFVVGGSFTPILESDLEFLKEFLKLVLDSKDYEYALSLINAFPTRDLPDLDIQLLCKKNSDSQRYNHSKGVLEGLGRLVLSQNPQYLLNQLRKDSPTAELTDLNEEIAETIINKYCLKKKSHNAFGTILGVGKVELIFAENPSCLLTPDLLKVEFDFDPNTRQTTLLGIEPKTPEGKEALLHRAAKIARVVGFNEHKFLKLCTYHTLGYDTDPEEAQKAVNDFEKFILSETPGKFNPDGKKLINLYRENHLQESPEEGIFTVFTICSLLTRCGKSNLVAPLLEELKISALKFKSMLPMLIQEALMQYPCNIEAHSYRILILTAALPSGHQIYPSLGVSWIISSKAYALRLTHSLPQALKHFCTHPNDLGNLVSTWKGQFFENVAMRQPLAEESAEIQIALADLLNLNIPAISMAALLLLLRCQDEKACIILAPHLLSCLNYCAPGKERDQCYRMVVDLFKKHNREKPLESPESLNTQRLWIERLAQDPLWVNTAYELWESTYIENDIEGHQALAHLMLPHGLTYALKILYRSGFGRIPINPPLNKSLRETLIPCLRLACESRKTQLRIELLQTLKPISDAIAVALIEEGDIAGAHELFYSSPDEEPDLENITKSTCNFWPILKLEDCERAIRILAASEKLDKAYEGVIYLSSVSSLPYHIKTVQFLRLFIPNYAGPKFQPTLTCSALHHLASAFKNTSRAISEVRTLRQPLLVEYLEIAHRLNSTSPNIIWIPLVEQYVELLTGSSIHLTANFPVGIVRLAKLCIDIANESKTKKFIQSLLETHPIFLEDLISVLRAQKHYTLINELKESLGLLVPTSKEEEALLEAECMAAIQLYESKGTKDENLVALFNKMNKLPSTSPVWEATVTLFGYYVDEGRVQGTETILNGVSAASSKPSLAPYNKKILAKLETCIQSNRITDCFNLLTLAHKANATSENREAYTKIASLLIGSCKRKNERKTLEIAVVALKMFPELSGEELPKLAAHCKGEPSRIFMRGIQELFLAEVKAGEASRLTADQRRSCLTFLANNGCPTDEMARSFLNAADPIRALFPADQMHKERVIILSTLFKSFTRICPPLNYNETFLLISLWTELEQDPVGFRFVKEDWIQHLARTRTPENCKRAVDMTMSVLQSEENNENLPRTLTIVLEEASSIASKNLPENLVEAIISLSIFVRKNHTLFVQPRIWIETLAKFPQTKIVYESLRWVAAYSNAKPPKESKSARDFEAPNTSVLGAVVNRSIDNINGKILPTLLSAFKEIGVHLPECEAVWRRFFSMDLVPIVDTLEPVKACQLMMKRWNLYRIYPHKDVPLHYGELENIVIQLVVQNQFDKFVELWNFLLEYNFNTKHGSCHNNIPVYTEVNKYLFKFRYLIVESFKSLESKKTYSALLYWQSYVLLKAMLENKFSRQQKAFCLDHVFNLIVDCFVTLAPFEESGKITSLNLLAQYIDAVQRYDQELYTLHQEKGLPRVLIRAVQDISNILHSIEFYIGLMITGLDQKVLDFIILKGLRFNPDLIEEALEIVFNLKWVEQAGTKNNLLPLTLMRKCGQMQLFKDIKTFLKFFNMHLSFIHAHFEELMPHHIIPPLSDRPPWFGLEQVTALFKTSPDEAADKKEVFYNVYNGYLALLDNPKITPKNQFEMIFTLLCTLSDIYSFGIESYDETYSTVLIQQIERAAPHFKDRVFKDVKHVLDMLLYLICKPNLPDTSEMRFNRVNALVNWISELHSLKTTSSNLSATYSIRFAKQNGVFEGFPDIETRMSGLFDPPRKPA